MWGRDGALPGMQAGMTLGFMATILGGVTLTITDLIGAGDGAAIMQASTRLGMILGIMAASTGATGAAIGVAIGVIITTIPPITQSLCTTMLMGVPASTAIMRVAEVAA